MAVDKLVDSTQLDSDLTSVANAIRTKGGTSAQLAFPSGFVSAIGNLPSGGGGNTPLVSGTITVTSSGGNRSFSVDLTKSVTKALFVIEPDATTKAAIEANTATTWYLEYLSFIYPLTQFSGGNTSFTAIAGIAFRGSTGTYSSRSASATNFTISISGTVATVTFASSGAGDFYPSGTYNINVWELEDATP